MDIDLTRVVDACAGLKVVVVGDAILDVYLRGGVTRLCREAPLGVVDVSRRDDVPGGAGNAAVNAATLGGRVSFVAVLGDDREGRLFLEALMRRGVDIGDVVVRPGLRTLTKHRLIGDARMLARFDQGDGETVDPATEERLIRSLTDRFPCADAVVLSDYGYGLFTPRIIRTLAGLQKRSPRVVLVDSRKPDRFASIGVTAVKPNFAEMLQLLGEQSRRERRSRAETVAAMGETVLSRCRAQLAAITLDAEGVVVVERGRPPYRTYARPQHQTRSIGGGDTYTAALALALAGGAETPAAAELAAAAAAVVLGKEGTASCSALELKNLLVGGDKRAPDLATLASRVRFQRGQGRRIVFTNGCFDILHRGHVALLSRAKGLGDVLVVGVNSDHGVRRLKGDSRPINGLEDRIKVLAALSFVDHIIVFDEDSPAAVIEALKPDIFVKGGDYTRDTLPEAALVQRLGGEVCILPLMEARSTSRLIERIREAARL